MLGMLPAELAVLAVFKLPLHQLLILPGVVINPVAGGTLQFY